MARQKAPEAFMQNPLRAALDNIDRIERRRGILTTELERLDKQFAEQTRYLLDLMRVLMKTAEGARDVGWITEEQYQQLINGAVPAREDHAAAEEGA